MDAAIYALDWSVNNQFIVLGSMNQTCKILYTEVDDEGVNLTESLELEGHEGTVRTVCITVEDNPKVVSAGQDNFLKIWDSSAGNLISNIRGYHSHVGTCLLRSTRSRHCWMPTPCSQSEQTGSFNSSI